MTEDTPKTGEIYIDSSAVVNDRSVQADAKTKSAADSTYVQKVICGNRLTLPDGVREILDIKVGDYVQFIRSKDGKSYILKKNPVMVSD